MTYHRTISPALMPPTYKQKKMKVQSIWSLLFDSPATEVKTRYPAINAGDTKHACGAARFAPGVNLLTNETFDTSQYQYHYRQNNN
jgi:hypothetical protein